MDITLDIKVQSLNSALGDGVVRPIVVAMAGLRSGNGVLHCRNMNYDVVPIVVGIVFGVHLVADRLSSFFQV